MSDMSAAQRAAYEVILPTKTGFAARTSAAISTTAVLVDLNASWGTGGPSTDVTINRVNRGGAFIRLTSTVDANVMVVAASETVAACTVTTGDLLRANVPTDYYVGPAFPKLDVRGTGAGTLHYSFSSRNISSAV